MGMKEIFKVNVNPLPWVDSMLGVTHTNFFENRVVDYAKGALSGSWGDVWGPSGTQLYHQLPPLLFSRRPGAVFFLFISLSFGFNFYLTQIPVSIYMNMFILQSKLKLQLLNCRNLNIGGTTIY